MLFVILYCILSFLKLFQQKNCETLSYIHSEKTRIAYDISKSRFKFVEYCKHDNFTLLYIIDIFQCLKFLLSKIYFSSNDMLKEIFQVDILKPNINLVNVVILLIYLLISFSVLIHTNQKKTNLLMAQTMKKCHQSKEQHK